MNPLPRAHTIWWLHDALTLKQPAGSPGPSVSGAVAVLGPSISSVDASMMFAAFLGSVQIFRNPLVREPPTTEAKVIRSYPHDTSAFTQGLFFEPGGTLLESTGLYGESSIRRVELDSGRVIKRLGLESDDWFGEGVTVQGGRCLQLLWREGLALERHPRSFELQRTSPPRGVVEGWGITATATARSTSPTARARSTRRAAWRWRDDADQRAGRRGEPDQRAAVDRRRDLRQHLREERIAVIEPSSAPSAATST